MKTKLAGWMVLLVLFTSYLVADNEIAPYLHWGVDARALSLGSAYSGVIGGAASVYWNPANIDFLQHGYVSGMHTFQREDSTYLDFVAYAQPFVFGSIGVGIVRAGKNPNDFGPNLLSYKASEFIFSYAFSMDSISVGINLKNISESYPSGDKHNGFGMDIGIAFVPMPNLNLSFVLQDIASKINEQNIPSTIRAGVSLEVIPGFMLSGDMEKIEHQKDPIAHIGMEYKAIGVLTDKGNISMRIGANNNEITTGLGIEFDNFSLDYAYVSQKGENTGESHHFSMNFLFGARPKRPKIKPKNPCVPCSQTAIAIPTSHQPQIDIAKRTAIPEDEDIDRDGIPNSQDQCPQQPEDYDGFQDEDGCPDYDNDQDGVPDIADQCPMLPEDIDGFQDGDGCPDYDNDQDGIPDVNDDCPNSAEVFNGFKDKDGCPDIAPVPPKWDIEILFDNNSSIIKKQYFKDLDYLVEILNEEPSARIEIHGFASSPADAEYNKKLSLKRAESVKKYLVQHGISADRLATKGLSETYLKDSDEASRRVEIIKIK